MSVCAMHRWNVKLTTILAVKKVREKEIEDFIEFLA